MKPPTNKNLKVVVRNRQGILFDGEATSVSSVNKVGPFDILPEHINFVSMINKKFTVRAADGRTINLSMDKGVVWVEENTVKVFIGMIKM